MKFELNKSIEILERTPRGLQELISGLSEDWTNPNEGNESWSAFDVMGHLVQGEKADWIPRVRLILEHGEGISFDSFDRNAQFQNSQGKNIEQLLEEFALLRKANIEYLKSLSLSEEDFGKKGVHPGLGVASMRQLLSAWVVHDLSHLAQIARVIATQYKQEVGPWREYMPFLNH